MWRSGRCSRGRHWGWAGLRGNGRQRWTRARVALDRVARISPVEHPCRRILPVRSGTILQSSALTSPGRVVAPAVDGERIEACPQPPVFRSIP